MAKNNGVYYFVKEDLTDNTKYYFDFEAMDYSLEKGKGVQLSTIDAMTSLFESPLELDSYLDRERVIDKETMCNYYISYKNKRKEEDRVLSPIWNDENISAISKITDGRVDYSNWLVYDLLFKMLEAIKDPANGFAMYMIKSKSEPTKVCDHNKSLLGVIASSGNLDTIPRQILMEAFSSYKEFRSFYLGFKNYHRQDKSLSSQLKKAFNRG